MAEVMTYDQFCERGGVAAFPPSFPETHRYPRRPSGAAQRAMNRRILAIQAGWQAKRDEMRVRYDALVVAGELRPPTRLERLSATAKGTGAAAEAAQRILASQYQGVTA